MARIEKTVFISYRRKDISWALAVYQYLTSQKYDVFFDFSSLSSGDFEQVIVSNIKARAHFVLILTPTALDRCSNPGDWLRREIETAIDEKRNIIPLFFDGFSFGSAPIAEKLTGKLSTINRYNGLDIPSGYFMEGMERLCSRYLNVPLNAVLHPISTVVRKIVKDEQIAVDKALLQKEENIKDLVKPAEEKPGKSKQELDEKETESLSSRRRWVGSDVKKPKLRSYGIGLGILLIATLGVLGINSLIQNATGKEQSEDISNNNLLPTNTPPLNPKIGSSWVSSIDGMVMVYVPAGEFAMGSENGDGDEEPVHIVFLDALWIDRTEVTNAMYIKCERAGKCNPPSSNESNNRKNYHGDYVYDNYPVINVSWDDASAYCKWAGRRLPTEAEWEKAARGDDERTFPWGEKIGCEKANFSRCVLDTRLVGSYPGSASPYGVLDMAGNVWEWVADWYSDTYYSETGLSNPLGPDSGDFRVIRSGSWDYLYKNTVYVYNRGHFSPESTYNNIGFRCARSE